jgi:proline iminopeptidase
MPLDDTATTPADDTGSMAPGPLAHGSHTALIDGNRLHYEVRGSGPVLLFPTPGWGPALGYLMPQPALERHCTVVYVETRRTGASTGPDTADGYALARFVSDIEELRQHLGAPRILVAGHSAGGHQALAYGAEHPDRVLGILCIDGIAVQDDLRWRELLAKVESRREHPFYIARPGFLDAAVGILSGTDTTPRSTDATFAAIGPLYFHDPDLAAAFFPTMEVDEEVQALTRAAGFQGDDLLPRLPRITAPTLVIVGDDDFICDPVSQAQRIHDRVPGSALEVVPGSGHVPWIEQPALFDRAVDRWLAATISGLDPRDRRAPEGRGAGSGDVPARDASGS